jgi:hypothetical protein
VEQQAKARLLPVAQGGIGGSEPIADGRHIRIDRADGFEIRCFLRRRREDEHENTGHRHKKRPKSRIFPGP